MTLEPDLWPAEVDPNQLENALLNLVVNARDAMADGGALNISTINHSVNAEQSVPGEWEAGDYVGVCVTDDGCGMPHETVTRVFERFFTTKEIGKGTGLGLSMVYGFVKQSGGHAEVVSAVGTGTTVTLYLPRIARLPEGVLDIVIPIGLPARGNAKILVVEDEAAVREFAVEVLEELGYTVFAAADGEAGLAHLAEHRDIALLFTDAILPGRLSGEALADAAIDLLPGLKILFTTGYAPDVVLRDGRFKQGLNLISKPYSYYDLAQKMHDLLARV